MTFLRGNVARLVVSVVLAVGLLTATDVGLHADRARAVTIGTWHGLQFVPHQTGSAVEGSARSTFKCNDATGVVSWSMSGVQVVSITNGFGFQEWVLPDLELLVGERDAFEPNIFDVDIFDSGLITQASNGLWKAKGTFRMSPALCTRNRNVELLDIAGSGNPGLLFDLSSFIA